MKTHLFVLALLLHAWPSCTPHRAYRALPEKTSNVHYIQNLEPRKVGLKCDGTVPAVPKSSDWASDCLEKYNDLNFWLGHVEYTDYGSFWDPRQLATLERALNQPGKEGPGDLFKNGATIVVYCHGWQNNSKEGNDNLTHFRNLLAAEAAKEKSKEREKRRGVLGIYLGWRGESSPIPLVKHAVTYWARKRVAHRVGQGNMVETLARIKNLHKDIAARSGKPAAIYKNSRLVLIGHSFGAAALYSAVGPHLESEFLEPYWDARRNAKRNHQDVQMERVSGYGDLVILINPAFEALPYRSLHYAVNSNRTVNYDPKQSLLMVVLSGKGDTANKTALPIGQLVGSRQQLFELSNDENLKTERNQTVSSLGHWPRFQSHELTLKNSCMTLAPKPGFSRKPKRNEKDPEPRVFDEDGDELPNTEIKGLSLKFPEKTQVDKSCIEVSDNTRFYPFMVISTDNGIIASHNGFWPKNNNKFCYHFVSWLIAQQNEQVGEARAADAEKFSQKVNSMSRQTEELTPATPVP